MLATQVELMKPDAISSSSSFYGILARFGPFAFCHLYFHWSVNISGSPICSVLFFKLILKNNKFIYLYYRTEISTIELGESTNATPNKD
jgi:hypothetical protein